MKVSICIPTYEMKGRGAEMLRFSLEKIFKQTHSDIEVIVSDQANDDSIKRVVEEYSAVRMPIFYYFSEHRGSIAHNLNNAVKKSTGDLIKFVLQDDFFLSNDSLQKEIENLGDSKWGLSATIHWDENNFFWHLIPVYSHNIYLGGNTIGSPSLLLCKRESCVEFDSNLMNLVDCDFYRQMYDMHGYPRCQSEITTVSRVWAGQQQRTAVTDISQQKEIEYSQQKHKTDSK